MSRPTNEQVRELLLELLCERIYPRHPELVRNDSRAARIVERYIDMLRSEYAHHRGNNKRTYNQHELVGLWYNYADLDGLGEEALRKHIRFLWESGSLVGRIEFVPVNTKR